MTTVKALFQEPSYKEESLNTRIITSGFFKGLEVFATGKIITPDKHIITPYTSKTHPTRCVNYQGRGLALWRLMCQIWKDDLSEFKTERDELEKINNYLLIYKFYSKYEHLIDKVCLIQNNYIITPENNYFNIISGKVTATSSLRHYFDKAPLNIPTVQADWKALTNTTVPAPIPEPVKISKSFEELIIKAGELAKEKQTITGRLNEINLQMDKILKEISLCK